MMRNLFSFLLLTLFINSCGRDFRAGEGRLSSQSEKLATLCSEKILALKTTLKKATLQEFNPAHRTALTEASQICLSGAIQIDTANHLENESLLHDYWQNIFQSLGVQTKRIKVANRAPGAKLRKNSERENLLAWIDGKSTENPVLLMNHADTVSHDAKLWTPWNGIEMPDLSGEIVQLNGEGKTLLGRGAIDMKNIGVMQMLSLALISFEEEKPARAIYFLSTADEESQASGVKGFLESLAKENLTSLKDPLVVLNEGGFGIENGAGSGAHLQLIGTEERGGAWIELNSKSTESLATFLDEISLLQMPNRVKLLTLKRDLAAAKCKLTEVDSLERQINTLPRKINLTLSCATKPNETSLQNAFKLAEAKDAPDVFIKFNDNNSVSIALQSQVNVGAGHGSSFAGISVLDYSAVGLMALGIIETPARKIPRDLFRYQVTPAMQELFKVLAKSQPLLAQILYFLKISPERVNRLIERFLTTFDTNLASVFLNGKSFEKVLRSSCSWSGFFGKENNFSATFDCRIIDLSGDDKDHGEIFTQALRDILKEAKLNESVTLKKISGWNFTSSDFKNKVFETLKETLEERFPGVAVSPVLIPGGTDSSYTRNPKSLKTEFVPTLSYGLTPALVSTKVLQTFHDVDERFPLDQLFPSVFAYYNIAKRLSEVD